MVNNPKLNVRLNYLTIGARSLIVRSRTGSGDSELRSATISVVSTKSESLGSGRVRTPTLEKIKNTLYHLCMMLCYQC
jgi:hypothetical protein